MTVPVIRTVTSPREFYLLVRRNNLHFFGHTWLDPRGPSIRSQRASMSAPAPAEDAAGAADASIEMPLPAAPEYAKVYRPMQSQRRTTWYGDQPAMSSRTARELLKERSRWELARRNAERERAWDATPMRYVPANLRGLKPITSEPWSRDAAVFAQKTGSFEKQYNAAMDGGSVEEYNDESILDSNNGYKSHITATGLERNASLAFGGGDGKPMWDSSPMRYCPHVLRGISPVTREPWCIDEKIYNRDTTRDTTMDERAGGGALDLGSISHATRAKNRQVDRPGFYMPNWEKWAAMLSA